MRIAMYIFLLLAAGAACSCSTSGRLARRDAQALLSHTPRPLRAVAPPADTVRRIRTNTEFDLIPVEVTYENGEETYNIWLDAVTVVAPSRTVPERCGHIEIDFLVTLPRILQSNCRSIVLRPVLHRGQERIPLEEISLRGTLFDRVQRRDYWQYVRYLERFRPDSVHAARGFRRFVRYPLPEGVRADSVTRAGQDISLRYVQRIPAAEAGRRLLVTLEGEIRGLDGSVYPLPPSDTLRYNISSMLFFADTTTRYVERIIEKHIRVSDRKRLAFRAGESCIVDTLENNEVQLSLIAQLMEKIFDRREYAVDSIILRAGASPEGPVRLNERLSRERAWNLQHRLAAWFPSLPLDTLIRTGGIGEDWETLAALIHQDDNIVHKQEIEMLIEQEQDPDLRETRIAACFPEEYAYMQRMLYPRLRAVHIDYRLHRTDMVQDTLVTTRPDSLYAEGVGLMQQRQYDAALGILAPYADINTAICLLSVNRNAQALELLLSLSDDDARVCYLRAIAYARQGKPTQSIQAFAAACALNEDLSYRAALDPELSELIKNR